MSFSSQKSINPLINSCKSHRVGMRSTSDYSGFGVQLDGRTSENEGYRYAFNGMEKDDEIKGNGNSYTTEFRQYDPRIGRWLTLDPLMMIFPAESPYNAFANNPIFFNDPYGLAPTNEGGPEKVTLKGDDRSYTSEYLPKTAENGQIIEIEFESHKLINTFSSEKQQWNTVMERVNSVTGATELSGGTWQDGWLDEMPQGSISSNQNTSISKTSSTTVEDKVESAQKKTISSPTVEILSKTTTIGGVIATTVETSADDMAKPPKYASKSIPNKKAWAPIAKGFKTAAKVAKFVGNILGGASAAINLGVAASKWKSGDRIGALKSSFKAAGDVALMFVKFGNPVGLAVSIGWAVFSTWW